MRIRMRDRIAALKARLGLCTCGGWACWLDNVTGCRVRFICDAHDRGLTD